MVMNGSNDKLKQTLTQWYISAEALRQEAETQHPRKAYSKIFMRIQKLFEQSLANRDFLKILNLEKHCQQLDAEFLNIDSEKATKWGDNLDRLTAFFKDGMDEEKVRNRYVPTMENYKAQGTRPRDANFEASVRAQSRFIGECYSYRSNFAEKSLYETRQKCLLALKQEHQRNLDRAMGYEKKKSHSKEKDQEISR